MWTAPGSSSVTMGFQPLSVALQASGVLVCDCCLMTSSDVLMLRFNSEISACDWPELVPCGQDHIRVSGAKMVWQKKTSTTTTTTTTTETPRTIVDFISSRDKEIHSDLEELTLEEELKALQSKSQIKESRNKIENVDEVLARVKGRLLPNLYLDGEMIRLNKQIPAKAVVVQTFKPRPGLRVMTAVRESYLPRGSVLV